MDTWSEWRDDEDWVVLRSRLVLYALTVRFSHASPSPAELSALRRISEEVTAVPLAELKQRVGHTGVYHLGRFSAEETAVIERAAEREGLVMSRELTHRTDMLPYHRATRMVCLLEDEEEAREVCREMIAAGRPVQESAD